MSSKLNQNKNPLGKREIRLGRDKTNSIDFKTFKFYHFYCKMLKKIAKSMSPNYDNTYQNHCYNKNVMLSRKQLRCHSIFTQVK